MSGSRQDVHFQGVQALYSIHDGQRILETGVLWNDYTINLWGFGLNGLGIMGGRPCLVRWSRFLYFSYTNSTMVERQCLLE